MKINRKSLHTTADRVDILTDGGSPTIDTVEEFMNYNDSSGYFDGGILSDATSGNINISEGSGMIRTTTTETDPLLSFKFGPFSDISITSDTTKYVYIDYNNGSPIQVLSDSEFEETTTKILIGVATNEAGSIESVFNLGVRLQESIGQAGRFIRRVFGISRDDRRGGLILGETGTRNITLTEGHLWWGRTDYTISGRTGGETFDTYYRQVNDSGWNKGTATAWDNLNYDDNTGTLNTLGVNRWGVLWFYLEPDDHIVMIYGRDEHNTQAQAENQPTPSTLPPRLQQTGVLIAKLLFKQNATDSTIETAFTTVFSSIGVTTHSNLSEPGMASGDDHTQYYGSGLREPDHVDLSNIGTNTHAQIDTHIASTANPHSVDDTDILASQGGNAGKFLQTDGSTTTWAAAGGGGAGTVNTVKSNDSQVGGSDIATLDFSSSFTVTESPDTEINITLDETTIDHTSIQNIGTNTHAEIDTHIDGSVGGHADVDTTTEASAKNDVLMFNGTNYVPVQEGTTFTFSCTSFSDGEGTTQLIGVGDWKAAEAISFTAVYDNGPPTTADIKKSINGAAYSTINTMDGAAYTSGNNTAAVAYPAAKDQYLRFRLDSDDGTDSDIDYDSAIYFRNKVFWGVIAKASSFTEADIEGLSSATTNDYTLSKSINAGAGEYIVIAYPTTYTAMSTGSDYETNGATSFKFKSVALGMAQDNASLSITNADGFEEAYDVYVSTTANLGSSTFTNVVSTTNQTIDPLYYGITTKTDTYLESDIEGLATNEITNDNTQVWDDVTTGAGEYMLFSFPKRLGIPAFWVGGFEGGFESPETVSVTNVSGWTEDYYVWRSTNLNLGTSSVETK